MQPTSPSNPPTSNYSVPYVKPSKSSSSSSAPKKEKKTHKSSHKQKAPNPASPKPPQLDQAYLERGDTHFARKELDLAIDEYTRGLEKAEGASHQALMASYIKKIGMIYLERGKYPMAAKLFNASLYLYEQAVPNHQHRESLLRFMAQTEKQYLQSHCSISEKQLLEYPSTVTYIHKREELASYRQEIKTQIEIGEASDKVLSTFTGLMSRFVDTLVLDCISILGKPPCQYALIGLGSLARKEMSPFSDLEFALLLKKDNPTNRGYFRKLARLLELKVIHLGETEIKVLGRGLFSPTPRGFSYDDGGNTPLGKESYVELMGTPEKMAIFQTEKFYNEDLILSNVLRTVEWMVGDAKLAREYEKQTQKIVNATFNQKLLLRQHRALDMLKGHLCEFAPRIDKQKEENPFFNVKSELYRLPSMLVSSLALYYGLSEKNTWERINTLHNKKVFNTKAAENLKKAMKEIMGLRIRSHLHYKSERDDVYHPSMQKKDAALFAKRQNPYPLSDADIEQIVQVYRVLLPLHRALEQASQTNSFASLTKNDLYDDSLVVQGQAYEKLLQYDRAKECYQKVCALNPEDVEALLSMAGVCRTLGTYSEAKSYAERALTIAREKEDPSTLSCALNLAGLVGDDLADNKGAIQLYEESLEIDKKVYGEEHPDVATKLNNLGSAYKALGEAGKAVGYLEQALRIHKKVYGEEHPSVATKLNNLGSAYKALGEAGKAAGYYEQALRIWRQVYNENHPHVQVCKRNLEKAKYSDKGV